MNEVGEIWKDIDGFEGLYQYSNTLKFRSIDRQIVTSHGQIRNFKGKILKISKSANYAAVVLYKNSKPTMVHAHVFFANIFIPNPENKKYVNHIDGNKTNYQLSNLEWNTKSEDLAHAYRTGLRQPVKGINSNFYGLKGSKSYAYGKTGSKHHHSQIVLDNETGVFYESITEAAAAKNINRGTFTDWLKGRYKNRSSCRLV